MKNSILCKCFERLLLSQAIMARGEGVDIRYQLCKCFQFKHLRRLLESLMANIHLKRQFRRSYLSQNALAFTSYQHTYVMSRRQGYQWTHPELRNMAFALHCINRSIWWKVPVWQADLRTVNDIWGAEESMATRLFFFARWNQLKVKECLSKWSFLPPPSPSLLFSPPPPRSNVIQSFVPADSLAVPSWLPSNGQAAAYEQDTAWINSPSALHPNHSGINQRRGGASSSSNPHNQIYFTRYHLPSAIHQIKSSENSVSLLRIWNIDIAVSF